MKLIIFKIALISFSSLILLSFELPEGWVKAGSQPNSYEMGLDKESSKDGSSCATIKSIDENITGFGTLMQKSDSKEFLGKRVRMKAVFKSKDVSNWSGLWFRVDKSDSKQPLAFDNMYKRAIKGTTDWQEYEIVLDVPENSSNIAYGALLNGTGQVWFDKIRFEIVDKSVPTTGEIPKKKELKSPTNLDFDH